MLVCVCAGSGESADESRQPDDPAIAAGGAVGLQPAAVIGPQGQGDEALVLGWIFAPRVRQSWVHVLAPAADDAWAELKVPEKIENDVAGSTHPLLETRFSGLPRPASMRPKK